MRGFATWQWPAFVLLCLSMLVVASQLTAQEGTGTVQEGTGTVQEGTGAVQEGTGDTLETPFTEPSEPPVPTVDDVMDHLNDLWRSDSSHSTVTMSIVTANWSRTLVAEVWTLGQDDALIIIRSPAREAGTATLRTDDGLWNYAPRADRLMRIPSGLLSESWMGSHFTNDDIVRESDYLDDFDTTLSWAEEDGTRYLLARSVPHPDAPVVYSRIDYYMTPDEWLPVRADYYDDEELVRSMFFSDIQQISGRPIPMTMELIPYTDPGESTTVSYDSLELDVPVSDSVFTQRGLRREAQRR